MGRKLHAAGVREENRLRTPELEKRMSKKRTHTRRLERIAESPREHRRREHTHVASILFTLRRD
ncbi:hypothetical protein SESBI_45562 [Sesbania bispinosa]|nr:hypothetical protein SESBI_45562 [Sesbania bispinosa]